MQETPWTVLVVDDEPINRKVLQAFLRQAGFEILTAENGLQARQMTCEFLPDLILLDIMMPGESGLETCIQLKQDVKTQDIPVIFLSALDDEQNKVQGFHAGGVDYVTKPFYQEEVLVRVKTHLKLRQAFERIIAEQAERLNQVKEGQNKLLVQPEDEPEAGYGVHYAPFYEAGGDFYDVFRVSPHIYAYFVGDISGHDLSASLVTSALKALVREYFSPLYSPQESLVHINNVLRKSFFDDGRHMTAVCLLLDRNKKKGTLVSSGHPPIIHIPQKGPAQPIHAAGYVLGVFDQIQISEKAFLVSPGDRFLLYSDGLIEHATQDGNRERGLDVLLQACRDLVQETDIQSFVHDLVQEIAGHRSSPLQDDIVALGVET